MKSNKGESLMGSIAPIAILGLVVGLIVSIWGNYRINSARKAIAEARQQIKASTVAVSTSTNSPVRLFGFIGGDNAIVFSEKGTNFDREVTEFFEKHRDYEPIATYIDVSVVLFRAKSKP